MPSELIVVGVRSMLSELPSIAAPPIDSELPWRPLRDVELIVYRHLG